MPNQYINFAFYSFITLILIVDPVGNTPVFVSMLENFKPEDRTGMIRKAIIIAILVLYGFIFIGKPLFDFIGVEMYSFKIAGGILLFIISLEMLFGRKSGTARTPEEEAEALSKEDIVVTPMAIPLLTGPGVITAGIVLLNTAADNIERAILLAVILLVFLVVYLILEKAKHVFDLLGQTGTKVVVRIMGLLLAAIAVQFVISGVIEVLKIALV